MSEWGTQVPYMWRRRMDLVWILNGYSPGRFRVGMDPSMDYPKVGMDSRRGLYESINEVWI